MALFEPQIVTGNTAHTRPENRAFYPALDGLRAIAFLMVFLAHYCYVPWGWAGVNVFFVLSGFLITGILFDTREDPHRARNFYVRRTLRIFPLYYGIFVVLLVLYPIMHWDWSRAWIAWPLYLGNFLRFLSPVAGIAGTSQQMAADAQLHSPLLARTTLYMGHFWSLCVEEQFYLLWPWIVFWMPSRRALLWTCSAVVLTVPFARALCQWAAPGWMLRGELLYRATPFQIDALLLGGLVSLLWRGQHRDRLVAIGRAVAAIAAISAVVYLARTLHPSQPDWLRSYRYPEWRLTWGLTFVNVFSAAVILCVLRPVGWLQRILRSAPLRWVGRISYGAYILHDIFHDLFMRTGGRIFNRVYSHLVLHYSPRFVVLKGFEPTALALFSLGATLLLAWLSFRFYESPFLNLKERWTVRTRG